MAAAVVTVGVVLPATSSGAEAKMEALGGVPISASAGAPATGPIDQPARVILLLDGEPALAPLADGDRSNGTMAPADQRTRQAVAQRRATLDSQHRQVAQRVSAAGIAVRDWTDLTDLVNAVALTVDSGQLDTLRALPGVSDVVPDQQARASTNDSVSLIGAPEVWKTDDSDGSPIRGKGSVVAVIDTGIDYNHPDLGAGYGEGHKVIGGHDFVNDDDDPMDDHYHGTHVAGIVAGNPGGDDSDGIEGVAPEASLLAYKVLNDRGTGYESDIIAGLQAAVSPDNPHRADVINMSLGTAGDGTDPLGRAATMAANLGAVVIAAAGNSGPGAHTMGSPAVADGVVAVGASASGLSQPAITMTSPKELRLQGFRAPFSANPPDEPVSGELVDVGQGNASDYERVGDVTGKIVAYRASWPRDTENVDGDRSGLRGTQQRRRRATFAESAGFPHAVAPNRAPLPGSHHPIGL